MIQEAMRAEDLGRRVASVNIPALEAPRRGLSDAPLSEPVWSPDRCKGGTRAAKVPNKTEADYRRHHLRGMDARYESLTFRMVNGHRYTPDWVVFVDGRPSQCHECKGGYALHSQQRARLAFDQVRVEFPGLVWVWAMKTKDGWKRVML